MKFSWYIIKSSDRSIIWSSWTDSSTNEWLLTCISIACYQSIKSCIWSSSLIPILLHFFLVMNPSTLYSGWYTSFKIDPSYKELLFCFCIFLFFPCNVSRTHLRPNKCHSSHHSTGSWTNSISLSFSWTHSCRPNYWRACNSCHCSDITACSLFSGRKHSEWVQKRVHILSTYLLSHHTLQNVYP